MAMTSDFQSDDAGSIPAWGTLLRIYRKHLAVTARLDSGDPMVRVTVNGLVAEW